MNETEEPEKRIELSVSDGRVRSPVDPDQQLDLASIAKLLAERLEKLKRQCEQQKQAAQEQECAPSPNPLRRDSVRHPPHIGVLGMPAGETGDHEYVCSKCGTRTVIHDEKGLRRGHLHKVTHLERCRNKLLKIHTVDLELVLSGFCSQCEPDVHEPMVRFVTHFPDVGERALDFAHADSVLTYLENLSHDDCTLTTSDCHDLAEWLGIDLRDTGNQ